MNKDFLQIHIIFLIIDPLPGQFIFFHLYRMVNSFWKLHYNFFELMSESLLLLVLSALENDPKLMNGKIEYDIIFFNTAICDR